MKKHTTGPWEIVFDKKPGQLFAGLRHYIYRKGADPMLQMAIASVPAHTGTKESIDRCTANAHLVASAPELLETCKNLLEYAQDLSGRMMLPEYQEELEDCMDEAEKVIAKAGEITRKN